MPLIPGMPGAPVASPGMAPLPSSAAPAAGGPASGGGAAAFPSMSPALYALGIAPAVAQAHADQLQLASAQQQSLTQALVEALQSLPNPAARAAQTEPGAPLAPGPASTRGGVA